ncbi:dephospho-CoA kinase [Carboxylicivirga taeanensis]|uniref:dephospho-CoA kinase n=1 Tax=Carboxylicivirga taeanensis TaxID=1416875 RepID=UPI003F6DC948
MIRVGLTGGIGSGKTTVARLLRALGFPVYEADTEAKQLINKDRDIREQIIHLLGKEAYNEQGYNRKYVGSLVFNNEELLQKLNEIVHPAVANHFEQWCTEKDEFNVVFQEAAVLFENGNYSRFDKTILVVAPEITRIGRVMQRDDMNKQEVVARINNQWQDDEKMKLADFVITCDGQHLVIPQVMNILKQL